MHKTHAKLKLKGFEALNNPSLPCSKFPSGAINMGSMGSTESKMCYTQRNSYI